MRIRIYLQTLVRPRASQRPEIEAILDAELDRAHRAIDEVQRYSVSNKAELRHVEEH